MKKTEYHRTMPNDPESNLNPSLRAPTSGRGSYENNTHPTPKAIEALSVPPKASRKLFFVFEKKSVATKMVLGLSVVSDADLILGTSPCFAPLTSCIFSSSGWPAKKIVYPGFDRGRPILVQRQGRFAFGQRMPRSRAHP